MTVSVCMGTYNGEKYIREQLESIKNQTRKPDEIIIYDDGSTDHTVEIIREFILMAESSCQMKNITGEHFPNAEQKREKAWAQEYTIHKGEWKFFVSKENRGYPACFYHAMSLCSGDLVFLADQDDIWDVQKLEKMCALFSGEDEVQALVCKFGLINETGEKINTFMAPARDRGTGELRRVSVHDVFYKGEWPGMVMAYRRKWYDKKSEPGGKSIYTEEEGRYGSETEGERSRAPEQNKVPEAGNAYREYENVLPHDLLISVWAAEDGAFRQLDEELAWHRRHENNAGREEHKIKKLLHKERKLGEIETYLGYLEVFRREGLVRTKEGQQALEEKLQSMLGRYEALRSGKRRKVLKNALKNRKNVRLATVLCDVAICHQRTI